MRRYPLPEGSNRRAIPTASSVVSAPQPRGASWNSWTTTTWAPKPATRSAKAAWSATGNSGVRHKPTGIPADLRRRAASHRASRGGGLGLERLPDFLIIGGNRQVHPNGAKTRQDVGVADHQRAPGLDHQTRLMGCQGFQNAPGEPQGTLHRLVRIGDARHVNGLAGGPGRLPPRQFHGVGLHLEPPPPVLTGPAVLRQEHGVAIPAAEGAADIRVAGPVESAPLDETGRRREDRPGLREFHLRLQSACHAGKRLGRY